MCGIILDSDESEETIEQGHVAQFWAHNSLSQPRADWSVERTKQEIKLTIVYISELPERFSYVESVLV